LAAHLTEAYGAEASNLTGTFLKSCGKSSAMRTISGALQRFGLKRCTIQRCCGWSSWLVDYPFADRLYAGAVNVIKHVRQWGPAVILSDGDAVFQPRKVERSGLWAAFEDRVLIYVHKERETCRG